MTDNEKHTPGPWHVHEEWDRIVNSADGNGDRPICKCEGPDGPANAHLIAAAPDLLEACLATERAKEAARSASEAWADGQRIPEPIARQVDALYMRAEELRRAAIAKARGL
jgi:hypothetical protein